MKIARTEVTGPYVRVYVEAEISDENEERAVSLALDEVGGADRTAYAWVDTYDEGFEVVIERHAA